LDLLDNEKKIFENIPQDFINTLYDFPKQFKKAEDVLEKIKLPAGKKINNVLILGVGISTIVAFKLLDAININRLNKPVIICTKRKIPSWVNKNTLVIASSHSGNSSEVLETVDESLKSGARVIAITNGGKLKSRAVHNKNIQLVEYGYPVESRMALGYIYVLITGILNRLDVIEICSDLKECMLGIEWDEVEEIIFEYSRMLGPDVKTYKNPAKITAINLFKNIPVIYGSNRVTDAVSYRLKSQICINSNNLAHYNTIPEMSHSEISAWEMNHDLREKFFVLFVTDGDLNKKSKTEVEIIKGLLMEKGVNFEELILDGPNDAAKSFKGVFLADWISIYLAILNNVDPVNSKLVDSIKNRLTNKAPGY
jgi:glucose/mannose-6-phosphate isomerase